MTVQISVVDLKAARPAVPAPAAARTDDAFARTLDRATQDRQPADPQQHGQKCRPLLCRRILAFDIVCHGLK